jgi:Spy/CpxP family protein refolding chaperone
MIMRDFPVGETGHSRPGAGTPAIQAVPAAIRPAGSAIGREIVNLQLDGAIHEGAAGRSPEVIQQEIAMKPTLRSLALLLVVAALPLAAQGFRHGRGPGSGPGAGPAFACLNLTDAQKASFKALHEKYRPNLEAARTTVFEAQKALRAAMANPATQDADLKALFDKASAARFAMLQQHRALMQESQALLTPDQKAQWEKMRAERQERMKQRGPGHGMGRGMGPGAGQGMGDGMGPGSGPGPDLN